MLDKSQMLLISAFENPLSMSFITSLLVQPDQLPVVKVPIKKVTVKIEFLFICFLLGWNIVNLLLIVFLCIVIEYSHHGA